MGGQPVRWLLLLLVLGGPVSAVEVPWTAETAILAVESDKDGYETKRLAISYLASQKATEMVPRLGASLRGRYDVTELRILGALGEIGDVRALPYLDLYEKRIAEEMGYVPGKLIAVLRSVKMKCASK